MYLRFSAGLFVREEVHVDVDRQYEHTNPEQEIPYPEHRLIMWHRVQELITELHRV
jgi:hypothetical protein